jgi:hypothetical protein
MSGGPGAGVELSESLLRDFARRLLGRSSSESEEDEGGLERWGSGLFEWR